MVIAKQRIEKEPQPVECVQERRRGVYSNRFQKEDFGEEDKFDPKVLPNDYLTNPQPDRRLPQDRGGALLQ